ncbi:MAG: DUF3109 family protein [Bacteroidales bacterium]
MLQIDDKIISLDVLQKNFRCDLESCAGVCCVHGDSGAPLEKEEEAILQQHFKAISRFMRKEGVQAVKSQGVAIIDRDGDLVTPLINGEECAYTYFTKDGLCLCAIEKAYQEGKIDYYKPISCHLYPIRLKKIGDNIALNYDQWSICECARALGNKSKKPVFQFLKTPLIRRFGEGFYTQLEEAYKLLS